MLTPWCFCLLEELLDLFLPLLLFLLRLLDWLFKEVEEDPFCYSILLDPSIAVSVVAKFSAVLISEASLDLGLLCSWSFLLFRGFDEELLLLRSLFFFLVIGISLSWEEGEDESPEILRESSSSSLDTSSLSLRTNYPVFVSIKPSSNKHPVSIFHAGYLTSRLLPNPSL